MPAIEADEPTVKPYLEISDHCLVPSMNHIAQQRLFVASEANSFEVMGTSADVNQQFYNVTYVCKKQKYECQCPPIESAQKAFQLAGFDAEIVSKETF